MKNFLNIWNDYTMLNIIGFLILGMTYAVMVVQPLWALELFGLPLVLFCRAMALFFARE